MQIRKFGGCDTTSIDVLNTVLCLFIHKIEGGTQSSDNGYTKMGDFDCLVACKNFIAHLLATASLMQTFIYITKRRSKTGVNEVSDSELMRSGFFLLRVLFSWKAWLQNKHLILLLRIIALFHPNVQETENVSQIVSEKTEMQQSHVS